MPYLASHEFSSDDEGFYFALADVKGEVQLVQLSLSTPLSALTLVDIKIFKHELATIFRHVQTTTLHPRDVRVIEAIGNNLVRYEEDSGTVFLAREIVDRMRKLIVAGSRLAFAGRRYSRHGGPTMTHMQYAHGSLYWQSPKMEQSGKPSLYSGGNQRRLRV
ncbi:hypothetical protein APHAL10511_003338 [Amanita phalloides]|nr:hypothetical protein APHAL10511_003338 [Amanita phalloides]